MITGKIYPILSENSANLTVFRKIQQIARKKTKGFKSPLSASGVFPELCLYIAEIFPVKQNIINSYGKFITI